MSVSWRTCQIVLASVVLVSCTDTLDPVAPAGGTATLDRDGGEHGARGKWALETAASYFRVDHLLTDKAEDFAVSLRIMPLGDAGSELVVNVGGSRVSGWDFMLLGTDSGEGDQAGHLAFSDLQTGQLIEAPPLVSIGEWHDVVAGRRDGHWFITLDHQDYDLGAAPVPMPIAPGFDHDNGFSVVLNQFDGLVDHIALRDLATHRTIERFPMEEGRGNTTVGQNGNKLTLFGAVWMKTPADDDDNGGHGGRAITACGTVITAKGDYTVARDLVQCPGAGIEVNASNVTLHLNGHIIDGLGTFTSSTNGIAIGVGVPGGVKHVKVLGPGAVREFAAGLVFDAVANSQVSGVVVERNFFGVPVNGFTIGEETHYSHDNVFEGNQVLSNEAHGFTVNGGTMNLITGNDIQFNYGVGVLLYVGGSNVVRDNQIFDNQVGIQVEPNPDSHGHLITRNTVLRSQSLDMVDNWGDCTHNTWRQNVFGTSNLTCIH